MTPDSASLNANWALVDDDGFAGDDVILGAGGGVVSIVKPAATAEPDGVTLPSLSVERMWTVYCPSGDGVGSA